ncbi:MAG: hypothetical protein J6R83_04595 [Clostridia bacterium]|nr:hypothetical protein [Clostridia bacterium]
MQRITLDVTKILGEIKPMHATNNGPIESNVESFLDAGIPCARLHDSSFYAGYGGEFTVDVHRIFENFDADENDPNSYDFSETDKYIKRMYENGIDIMYRLGASIEHRKKKGTIPPKDTLKWARICEHIMLHYNEGWKDGFTNAVKYWEIWNEPELEVAGGNKPCWQGTYEEFLDFFVVVYKYLKQKFPNYIIGGPSFTLIYPDYDVDILFFEKMQKENVKLDFLSFHRYDDQPKNVIKMCQDAKDFCLKFGQEQAEIFLTELNYIYGWIGKQRLTSYDRIANHYGASFVLATMLAGQTASVDMMMYYDARPHSGFNGLFKPMSYKPLKAYYSLKYFNELYKLQNQVEVTGEVENVYCVAATDGDNVSVVLTHYYHKRASKDKEFELQLKNLKDGIQYKAEIFLTGKKATNKLVQTNVVKSGDVLNLTMSQHDSLLVKLTPSK